MLGPGYWGVDFASLWGYFCSRGAPGAIFALKVLLDSAQNRALSISYPQKEQTGIFQLEGTCHNDQIQQPDHLRADQKLIIEGICAS